jgi:tRNA dimethylallyltransferase
VTAPLLPSLVGATASGKTRVAIDAARLAGLEVLSADSRQIYRRLDVGTAKPSAAERAAVPHHLLDVADPEETYTAARFGREAREAMEDVRARGKTPFLVGGSGLYLRAAEEGLFEGPEADAGIRARLHEAVESEGREALHRRLAEVDPETASRLHPPDVVRVVRALEVWELTGTPISEHHRRHRESLPALRFLRFGIEWPAAVLVERIERRVDAMLDAGWIEEVRRLLDGGIAPGCPALRALGYPEIVAVIRGELSEAAARDRIILATRQFAKRQRTWFRAVPDVMWSRMSAADDLDRLGETIATAIGDRIGRYRTR